MFADANLTSFICDYCRLVVIGNARTHEIEALMDEELQTVTHDKLKPYYALTAIAERCRRSASSPRCSASCTPWRRSTNLPRFSAA